MKSKTWAPFFFCYSLEFAKWEDKVLNPHRIHVILYQCLSSPAATTGYVHRGHSSGKAPQASACPTGPQVQSLLTFPVLFHPVAATAPESPIRWGLTWHDLKCFLFPEGQASDFPFSSPSPWRGGKIPGQLPGPSSDTVNPVWIFFYPLPSQDHKALEGWT